MSSHSAFPGLTTTLRDHRRHYGQKSFPEVISSRRDESGMSHLRALSVDELTCPPPNSTARSPPHLKFHATLAHKHVDQDPRRSTKGWKVDRPQSTRKGDLKIVLGELVVDTADGECDIVRGTAVDGVLLAGKDGGRRIQRTSTDSTSVVGPAGKLIPESMMT